MKQLDDHESRPATEAHPSPSVLEEYRAGLLAAGQEAAVQEHLSNCPACVADLLELAGPAPDGSEGAARDLDVERAWRSVRQRLPVADRAKGRRYLALAAVLALFLVGALLLRWTDRERGFEAQRLTAVGGVRGLPPASCPALPEAPGWRVEIEPPAPGSAAIERLRITTEHGVEVGRTWALESWDGRLGFMMREGALPAGRYRLQALAGGDGEPLLIEQYCFEIPAR